ncbi:MAG: hypothetical protein FWD57_04425 [Polyangiaceae bacterium]|nr:hypothetical protein [Polyangiaceae bacterium]
MDCPHYFDKPFLDDLPYEPSVLLLDRIESFDESSRVIVCRMPTDTPSPFTDAQRNHPVKHPPHVSGSAMIHVTGMLGFIHLYYMLHRTHAEGWVGFGTHIHKAVFRKLVTPGSPMLCSCKETKVRLMGSRIFVTYEFEFRHEDQVAYESKQSAMWLDTNAEQPTQVSS